LVKCFARVKTGVMRGVICFCYEIFCPLSHEDNFHVEYII
jgi:hypothetical protein